VARTILADTPVAPLHEAKDGDVVKVIGTVREAAETLTSPYSKLRCVHYHLRIVEVHARKNANIRIRYRESVDFVLDADGLSAHVSMDDAVVITVHDVERQVSGDEDLEVSILLREHGFGLAVRVELTEGTIEPGERVAVVGRVRRTAVRAGTGGSYREPPQQITLEAPADHPLILSDDPDTF